MGAGGCDAGLFDYGALEEPAASNVNGDLHQNVIAVELLVG